jgi:hypothetical protein
LAGNGADAINMTRNMTSTRRAKLNAAQHTGGLR